MSEAAGKKRRRRPSKGNRRVERQNQQEQLNKEIQQLEKRIRAEAPARGSNPLADDAIPEPVRGQTGQQGDSSAAPVAKPVYGGLRRFEELPLSSITREALIANRYTRMTDIQRAAIPHALAGRDILGAARTGSGKTLAFLVPMIENLFRMGWRNTSHGLGAIVLSPLRELAVQIFSVLTTMGGKHELSAGLVIGGNDFITEQETVAQMNVLVATPGRLLQHLEQTPEIDASNVKILIIDEADRCLDMGFRQDIYDIIGYLPKERQTMLFSATQTKSVSVLAKLSLRDPEYIAVHEHDESATPNALTQHYMVVPAHKKLDMLWSFLKTHLASKIIIFASSCKQVQYLYEMFRRLRPGTILKCIHGRIKQQSRIERYYEFYERESGIVLFATDVAARGLDFPDVDWVIQFDCPEDGDTYIHRVGRTARNRSKGHGLLFLLPSELGMIEELKTKRVTPKKVMFQENRFQSIVGKIGGYLAEESELKYLAQRALVSYLRAVHRMGHAKPDIFDVTEIDAPALAASMGLPNPPKLKFVKKAKQGTAAAAATAAALDSSTKTKNLPYQVQEKLSGSKTPKAKAGAEPLTQAQKLLRRQNQTVLAESRVRLNKFSDDENSDAEDEEEEEFMVMKRKDHDIEDAFTEREESIIERKELNVRKGDMDKRKQELEELKDSELFQEDNVDQEFLQRSSKRLLSADQMDKLTEKQRVREKHRKQKLREKMKERRQTTGEDGEDGEEVWDSEDGEDASDFSGSDGEDGDSSRPEEQQDSDDDDDDDEEQSSRPAKRLKQQSSKPSISDLESQALALLGKR